jgi:hypothetical protein
MSKDENNWLMLEYEKAQDSAEHHNQMAWVVSSLFILTSLTLFGEIIANIEKLSFSILSLGVFIGIFLIIVNGILFFSSQKTKIKKYEICKGIERKINKQLFTEENPLLKNHLSTDGISSISWDYTFLYY